jgi:16S rRNA (guanine(527)-N(7))-methyltransferase RsmG
MSPDRVNEFRSALETAVASFGLDPLLEEEASRLAAHYEMLCQWNHRVNLTRIAGPGDAATFHYAESIFGARFIAAERTLLDIGSGAGFPGLPLAVIRRDLQVTALEANHKKSLFLKEAKEALSLANFKVVTARVEDFAWAGYELLTSRALERPEAIFSSVLERMRAPQRLMLYCGPDLVNNLEQKVGMKCRIETHPIPDSDSRIIAIFSRG